MTASITANDQLGTIGGHAACLSGARYKDALPSG